MMVDFEERKKVVYIELEPGTHRQLQDLASSLGIRISEAGGMCVERDLTRRAQLDPGSLETRLFLGVQEAKRRQEIRVQLRRIAWQNLQEEDEEAMDALALLCDEAGVPAGVIIEEARRHDTPPMVYDGSKLAEAVEFLHEIGRAVKELPTTEVMSTGADRNLSSSILKQAKKSLGITSERRPLHWAWVWPETNRTN
jgi:hypothetical protein